MIRQPGIGLSSYCSRKLCSAAFCAENCQTLKNTWYGNYQGDLGRSLRHNPRMQGVLVGRKAPDKGRHPTSRHRGQTLYVFLDMQ